MTLFPALWSAPPPATLHIRRKRQPSVEDAASRTTQAATKGGPLSSPEVWFDLELLEEATKYLGPTACRALGSVL